MSTKDTVRWLKAAAQLLVSGQSLLSNIAVGRRPEGWKEAMDHIIAAYRIVIQMITRLGGFNDAN